jgi:hypothetical protein
MTKPYEGAPTKDARKSPNSPGRADQKVKIFSESGERDVPQRKATCTASDLVARGGDEADIKPVKWLDATAATGRTSVYRWTTDGRTQTGTVR